jgi:hypothetical protein
MQKYILFVLLTACSAHRAEATDPTDPTDLANPTIRLTCNTSIPDYCAANGCDRTLTAAEHDQRLCPATLTRCGKYEVVVKGSIDVVTRWYYQAGHLVAITSQVLPSRYTCLAGPSTFNAPRCAGSSQPMPDCNP